MLYINFKVLMHGDVISGNYVYVWASMHNSGHKCLLPDRPEFGLKGTLHFRNNLGSKDSLDSSE